MRFAPILFNFVAGVSAIDIWLNWDATDCRGKNSVHCANATFGQDTSVCMSFGGYGGGGYHFINDRRRSVRRSGNDSILLFGHSVISAPLNPAPRPCLLIAAFSVDIAAADRDLEDVPEKFHVYKME
ncbi:predicted protein [Verticillium alfalfae VaMs.102]|uniref:Predicted protein n=1 Tax=Verticillium alfalfae (strain VaMs.102 / ATCC MYA-4576 / FGSC 10136) TaxID=526221 RepID=C9ST37_VERA1|nr:predicted protein [Verticillium alfalfae VaMs.102]EEY21952.1 predicted protein [Verticillium alfalfae VaMs.102]